MRPVNISKLDGVKFAAIKTIARVGYAGATVALIAKEAGVSDGYLYRHYANKSDLVKSLFIENMNIFHNHIFGLLETEDKIEKILEGSFRFMMETFIHVPEMIAFIFLMDHDHNFNNPKEVGENFKKIGKELMLLGHKTGEINKQRGVEDIIMITFGLPIKLVELRRKKVVTERPLDENDIQNLVNICLNALA